MTLSREAQRETCRRQLARLRAPNLERHKLLDIATALTLLIGSLGSDDTEDVAGHHLGGGSVDEGCADDAARADLAWVQAHGRTGSREELLERTRRAANALCSQLDANRAINRRD